MTTWILLLRGINVGGHSKLPMAELKHHLESLKLRGVQTYVNSGNVVFQSSARTPKTLRNRIAKQIKTEFDLAPRLMLMTAEDLHSAVVNNPYTAATAEPKTLHFFFLSEPSVAADSDALNAVCAPTERWRLTQNVLYLHTPDGFAKSRLAGRVEKLLGVAVTARNYRTVAKLLDMSRAGGPCAD